MAVTAVIASLLLGTVISIGQAIRATEASEQAMSNEATAKVQTKRAQQNLLKARDAVEQMLTRVADDVLANVPQMTELRRKLLEDALKFYEGFLNQESDDPRMQFEAALVQARLGNVQRWLGRSVEAAENYRKSIARLNLLTVDATLGPPARVELVMKHLELSAVAKHEETEKCIRRAVELAEELVADFPNGDPYYHFDRRCPCSGDGLSTARPLVHG
jgi:tetratricopeptide (TPR) repeat protein